MAEGQDEQTSSAVTPAQKALGDLWDQHLAAEFAMRDADQAVATMVEDVHVNHIPVMTGAVGREQVRDFNLTHFLPQIPRIWRSSRSRAPFAWTGWSMSGLVG